MFDSILLEVFLPQSQNYVQAFGIQECNKFESFCVFMIVYSSVLMHSGAIELNC